MARRIVVVGSSNTDMIIKSDRIPRPGETVLGGTFSLAAGGKGANQAVAAARAGGDVSFIARVGNDAFGEQALCDFREDGIDVQGVIRDADSPSGVALIFVDKHGQNCIAVASGANARLCPADVEHCRAVVEGAGILLMQLETPLDVVARAAELAVSAGAAVILNPAPATELPPALLRNVTLLTPNESEAAMLTGISVEDAETEERAARVLLSRGVGTVIVTLGARGAFYAAAGESGRVPAFPVEAVDTTAAGDVFNGALAVAFSEGRPLREAIRFANAAAALSVTRMGAQPSIPRREQIEAFLRGMTDADCGLLNPGE